MPMARHHPSSAAWQYVSLALHDMERLAARFGQLDRFCDSILELENQVMKRLNEYRGGNNARELQQQKIFAQAANRCYEERKCKHTNNMGRAGQRLRKANDAKELSRHEVYLHGRYVSTVSVTQLETLFLTVSVESYSSAQAIRRST